MMLLPALLTALRSPVARYAGLTLAAVLFIAWQRHDAASDARRTAEAACAARLALQQEAERSRQRAAGAAALRSARQRAETAEAEAALLKEESDELLTEIRESGAACHVPDDLAERLRAIR